MSVKKTFGVILKQIRTEKGISQETLALDAETNRTFISEIERGLKQPSITSVFKIAQALKMKPSELIKRIEENNN